MYNDKQQHSIKVSVCDVIKVSVCDVIKVSVCNVIKVLVEVRIAKWFDQAGICKQRWI